MVSIGAVNSPAAAAASAASASRIEGLDGWLAALSKPSVLTELAALGACVLLAWLVPWLLSRTRHLKSESSILFGRRIVDGVLFPLLLLSFAYVVQTLLVRRLTPQELGVDTEDEPNGRRENGRSDKPDKAEKAEKAAKAAKAAKATKGTKTAKTAPRPKP